MIRYVITLEGMKESYRHTRYEINRKHGSAYELWSAMGGRSDMRREEIAYLRTMSVPRLPSSEISELDGRVGIEALLPPHGCH